MRSHHPRLTALSQVYVLITDRPNTVFCHLGPQFAPTHHSAMPFCPYTHPHFHCLYRTDVRQVSAGILPLPPIIGASQGAGEGEGECPGGSAEGRGRSPAARREGKRTRP